MPIHVFLPEMAGERWEASHGPELEVARERFSHTRLQEPLDAHAHIAFALQSLPARWQTVLWYSEVMEQPPRRIAPLMGITPNAVSALLRRAKTGLRTAYLKTQRATAAE